MDPSYQQLLPELLSHQELKPYILVLQQPELKGFVDLLDNVSESDGDIHSP